MNLVEENCPCDVFENAIRRFGIVAACEWFGFQADSKFTKETIRFLNEKAEHAPQRPLSEDGGESTAQSSAVACPTDKEK